MICTAVTKHELLFAVHITNRDAWGVEHRQGDFASISTEVFLSSTGKGFQQLLSEARSRSVSEAKERGDLDGNVVVQFRENVHYKWHHLF